MIDENKLEAGYEAVAEHMSFGIYRAAVKAYEAAKAEEQVVEYHQAFIDAAIHGQGFMKDGKHIPRSEVFKSSDNPNQPPESAAGSEWQAGVREIIQSAHDDLMNLQPQIPICCYPKYEIFIDTHVDVAMEKLDKALAALQGKGGE